MPSLALQKSTLIGHLFIFFFLSLSFPISNHFQFEGKESPNYCFVSCRESLPTANFSTSVSLLRKLAVSTFQLIAYWHTPDSKYLCSSRECLVQLSTCSRQPAFWFQHLRISKRGNNMQMPKSPRENSSGEAVTGGRERSSDERYYCSLETGKLGLGGGKGRGRESEDRQYSVTAQDAVSWE